MEGGNWIGKGMGRRTGMVIRNRESWKERGKSVNGYQRCRTSLGFARDLG